MHWCVFTKGSTILCVRVANSHQQRPTSAGCCCCRAQLQHHTCSCRNPSIARCTWPAMLPVQRRRWRRQCTARERQLPTADSKCQQQRFLPNHMQFNPSFLLSVKGTNHNAQCAPCMLPCSAGRQAQPHAAMHTHNSGRFSYPCASSPCSPIQMSIYIRHTPTVVSPKAPARTLTQPMRSC